MGQNQDGHLEVFAHTDKVGTGYDIYHIGHLSKIYNTTQEEPRAYWEETHASITRDGSRVVWAENWGQNVGQEALFLTQLTMPTNWRVLTGGQ